MSDDFDNDDDLPFYQRRRSAPPDDEQPPEPGFKPDPVSGIYGDEHWITKEIRDWVAPIIEQMDGKDMNAKEWAHNYILGKKNAGHPHFAGIQMETAPYVMMLSTATNVIGAELCKYRHRKDTKTKERRHAVPKGAGAKGLVRRQFAEMTREDVIYAIKGYDARVRGNTLGRNALIDRWNDSGKGDPIQPAEWMQQEGGDEEGSED